MQIKNLVGTSDNKCKCGSWLNHWENYAKKPSLFCSVNGCNEMAEVGAHVQTVGFSDQNWYIVPFCHKHNKTSETFDVGNTTLVFANVSVTCGE